KIKQFYFNPILKSAWGYACLRF
ncbi:Hg(II)-responsive transcriptional regulator, partial [Bacillus pseudomycoides]